MKQGAIDVVHVTTVHRSNDNRIFNKECRALREAGVAIALVARGESDDTVEDVPLLSIKKRSSRIARMILGPLDALRRVRESGARLVHIHDPELIPLGVLLKATTRKKVVYDAHEDLEAQILGKSYLPDGSRLLLSKFGRGLEKIADRYFDGVVVVLPEFADRFTNRNVVVVQNYPWLQSFSSPRPASAPNKFLYIGSVTRARGAKEMLAAVARSVKGAQLTIVGPAEDADLAAEISSAASTEYLGRVDPSEISTVIESHSVGLALFQHAPNHMTSKPTKLFEYMAAGRPFIASDFPYWKQALGDDTGLFVDPTDVDAIAAAMDRLSQDPNRATAMGMNGRRRLESEFTFENEAPKLVSMVEQLIREIGESHNRASKWGALSGRRGTGRSRLGRVAS